MMHKTTIQSNNTLVVFITLYLLCALCYPTNAQQSKYSSPKGSSPDIWVSAYLASWNHFVPPGGNWGHLTTDEIQWNAFTHLIYFAFRPKQNGSLSEVKPYQNLNPDRITEIVAAAHQRNKPILFTVGGSASRENFKSAFSDKYRDRFIRNIISALNRWKFDGVDLDMEPLRKQDKEAYVAFVSELHKTLQQYKTPLLETPLLTVATTADPSIFINSYNKIDQINIMTYDMSGAWPGWVSWHNSPLYNGGHQFSNGNYLPSVNRKIEQYISAGIPSKKIGLGIDFYGYIWHGVSQPREGWQGKTPKVEKPGGVAYYKLAQKFNLNKAKWDDTAKVPYISIKSPKTYVSFSNERSIKEKMQYIRSKKLGGAILWEITADFIKNAPLNQQHPLLNSIQQMLTDSLKQSQ